MATPNEQVPAEPVIEEEGSGTAVPNAAATPDINPTATPVPSSGENITTSPSQTENTDIDTSKLKSEVWQHMFKRLVDGEIKAVCKYCETKLSATSTSGTRHIHSHIKTCLEKRQARFPLAFQKLLVAKKVDGKTQLSNYAFDPDEARTNLVEMVILHEYPLSMVEHFGFQRLLGCLQPMFKVPSRRTLTRDVVKLYVDHMKTTMALLDSNKGRVRLLRTCGLPTTKRSHRWQSQHIL